MVHPRSRSRLLRILQTIPFVRRILAELSAFIRFFSSYIKLKFMRTLLVFEKQKNILVKFFTAKRGRYNRPFLHAATMGVLGLGILIGPFLADTYPVFSNQTFKVPQIDAASSQPQSIIVGDNVFQTDVSQKPRSSIIIYTVQPGDTISTIAKNFGISEDTVKWANSLTSNDVSIGDSLSILPVSGVSHKVESGDTVYSIAKKYNTDAQQIADFPFNDFANPETFSLVIGEVLIVPNGVPPESQSNYKQPQYISINQGTIPLSQGGWYWPVEGIITQYPAWYHMAIDIAGSIGSPVYSAHSGTVDRVSEGTYDGGYGNNVWINDGDGIKTHYAHLNSINVSVGQSVVGGKTVIGTRGNTGRSTGPHTHFEISVNGSLINPLTYVSPQ
jgi:murein DD-endopeptidase MepM/ murein hydrolase activator NlpD